MGILLTGAILLSGCGNKMNPQYEPLIQCLDEGKYEEALNIVQNLYADSLRTQMEAGVF